MQASTAKPRPASSANPTLLRVINWPATPTMATAALTMALTEAKRDGTGSDAPPAIDHRDHLDGLATRARRPPEDRSPRRRDVP